MTNNTDFRIALAEICYEMFKEGCIDPSARDITQRYYQGKQFSDGAIEDVRKSLSSVRRLITDEHHEVSAILLAQKYYDNYQKRGGPVDVTHAALCLPMGQGKKAVGILFCVGKENLIYKAFQKMTSTQTEGVLKRATNIIMNGLQQNLTKPDVGRRQLKMLADVIADPGLTRLLLDALTAEVARLEKREMHSSPLPEER